MLLQRLVDICLLSEELGTSSAQNSNTSNVFLQSVKARNQDKCVCVKPAKRVLSFLCIISGRHILRSAAFHQEDVFPRSMTDMCGQICLPIKGNETYEITILLCPSRFHIIGSNFDGEYIEVSQPLIGSFNQLDILSTLSSDRILNPMRKRPRPLMILSVEIFNTS